MKLLRVTHLMRKTKTDHLIGVAWRPADPVWDTVSRVQFGIWRLIFELNWTPKKFKG
jgi:hypothetical protein